MLYGHCIESFIFIICNLHRHSIVTISKTEVFCINCCQKLSFIAVTSCFKMHPNAYFQIHLHKVVLCGDKSDELCLTEVHRPSHAAM